MRRPCLNLGRFTRRTVLALLAMLPALLAPAMALAQSAPPEPSLRQASSPLLGYFIMFVLVVAVVTISIMPSKRSHQD